MLMSKITYESCKRIVLRNALCLAATAGLFGNLNALHAQVGTTCEDPIYVAPLPFNVTDNTANYADVYDPPTSAIIACGSGNSGNFYLGGNDVVYKLVPSYDTVVNIEVPNAIAWSGVFVFAACADIGVNVLACSASSSSGNRLISNLPLTAGEDYTIILSTWPQPQSFAYTLNITASSSAPDCGFMMQPQGLSLQSFDYPATVADLVLNGPSIAWFADEELTQALENSAVLENGVTYYGASNFNGCSSAAFPVTVEVPLATDEFAVGRFTHFPNPVKDTWKLDSSTAIKQVTIYNVLGQTVLTSQLNAAQGEVNLAQLTNGQYVAKIEFATGAEKVVKLTKS